MQSRIGASTSSSTFGSTEKLDNLLIELAKVKLPPKNVVIDSNQRSKRDLEGTRKREIEENKLAQERLANDIILSRFPCKPNTETVITKLCNLFKILKSDIKFYRCFETRNNDSEGNEKRFHHIKIAFKENSIKLKVLSQQKHPIKYSTLCDKPLMNAGGDPIITCLNSLSSFNIDISKQLQNLVVNRIIKDYRFTNKFFKFKQNPLSPWTTVTHRGVLQKWHDLLKSQRNLKLPKPNPVVLSDWVDSQNSS